MMLQKTNRSNGDGLPTSQDVNAMNGLPLEPVQSSLAKATIGDPLEPTIFHERWWLELATDGHCRFAEVVEKAKVVGRLPYVLKNNRRISIIDMPPLTHFLGPAIVEGHAKENTRFLRRLDITQNLIEQLPRTSSAYIKCHRGVSDLLAFQKKGFRASVQFTHEIQPQPIDDVWKGMRDKGRNGVRLARENAVVQYDLSSKEFAVAYDNNLAVLGLVNSLDMPLVQRMIDACISKGRGTIFGLRSTDGRLISAIFCAWDEQSYYYLMSTRTTSAHRGAISLLIWEAISDAMNKRLIFDFDGIVDEGGARLAANFTGTVAPRYIGTRESSPMRLLRALQAVRTRPNYFCR